jgi:phosphosulfolactate phosphohydrolase-like enzyme
LIGSFRNLNALTRQLCVEDPERLILVCSGTREAAAYEDAMAAGALCERLTDTGEVGEISDSARMALDVHRSAVSNPFLAMRRSSNARRLLALEALADDVAFCLAADVSTVTAGMQPDGWVVRV